MNVRLNHRLRLAAVSAGATGVVLALLFAGVVVLVRQNADRSLTTDLVESLRASTLDPKEPFDATEFRAAYPAFEVRQMRLLPEGLTAEEPKRQGHRFLVAKPFRGEIIEVSADAEAPENTARVLGLVLAGLWPLLTLLIGLSTWLAACAVFRPLERLTGQAATFAGEDLEERLQTDDAYEFGEFATSLNGMLERIETEVRKGDRFARDAAHELRTPLTILRTRIDMTLLNTRSPEEYQETLRRTRMEIDRLTEVSQALLRTARGETCEAGSLRLRPVLEEVLTTWTDRAVELNLGVKLAAEEASAIVLKEEVRIVLDNLLDNAFRFAPEGSVVSVSLRKGEVVELSVSDQGPGFPDDLGDRAFDRLIRGDDSRNRSSGGAGLGLSMVRRIAESRGGTAAHEKTPGGGATVVVRLPAIN